MLGTLPLSGNPLSAAGGLSQGGAQGGDAAFLPHIGLLFSASGGVSAALTGQGASFTQVSLAPAISVAIAGQQATLTAGTLGVALSASLAGQSIASAHGTLTPALSVLLGGQSIASAQGIVSTGNDVTAALTGLSILVANGSLGFLLPPDAGVSAGGFWLAYERETARRRKKRRELDEAEESARALQDAIDRELAKLLQEQERKAEFQRSIERLKGIVGQFADREAEVAMSERVRKALARAMAQESVSAYLALQRELERMLEEEEVALMMILNDE